MKPMTSRERIQRMYEHREADRVPITDGPWASTIARWHREGLPENVNYADYFDLDRCYGFTLDNTPRYKFTVLEETEEYQIHRTPWGVTLKNWKLHGGVPEYLDFTVVDPDSWRKVKERIQPTEDRIEWDKLKENFKQCRENGGWMFGGLLFGFDVTKAYIMSTERLLIAMAEQPEWVMDIFNHCLETHLKLYDRIWEAGFKFDEMLWWDDMGYKQKTFFSLTMYRELLKPFHKRAVEWAHAKGLRVQLHSCGYIEPLIPDLIEIGLEMLNPIEVKSGMDPIALKHKFGDKLAFHGALSAILFNEPHKMWEEMRRVIPVMKQGGGYWMGSDHSVPDCVSLEDFREFVRLGKELGTYG